MQDLKEYFRSSFPVYSFLRFHFGGSGWGREEIFVVIFLGEYVGWKNVQGRLPDVVHSNWID